MAATIAGDVRRLGSISPNSKAAQEWKHEMEAFTLAKNVGEKPSIDQSLGVAARLVEATTDDPAYNLFDDEYRIVTTSNPFNTAFKRIHGDVNPVKHYTQALQEMTGHQVTWDTDKRRFVLGGRTAVLDHLEF